MYVTLSIYHISSVLNGLRYDVCYTINIPYILSVEWVEIRCPRSGEPMFANLETGECLWEVPLGALV